MYYGITAQPELKYYDTISIGGFITVAGLLEESLNKVLIGNTGVDRIGKRITIKSLHVRGEIILAADENRTIQGDVFSNEAVAMDIILDKQCNKSATTIAGTSGLYATSSPFSHENEPVEDRYVFLHRELFVLNSPVNAWGEVSGTLTSGNGVITTDGYYGCGQVGKVFNINIENLNIPIDFSGTTPFISEVVKNNLLIAYRSNTGKAYIEDMRHRIRFTDL